MLSVAKLRLADKAAEVVKRRGSLVNVEAGNLAAVSLASVAAGIPQPNALGLSEGTVERLAG